MQRATWIRTALLFSVLVAGSAGLVVAQTDDESNGGVQFNFSTPGARSLAMGGSFLGSVDDATAAYSNPAGLLQLSEIEVSVEGRRWSYSTPYADRGRAAGSPTGIGLDTIAGVELGTAESELEDISFASVVIPRKKWALALYFHQLAKFQSSFSTAGIFGEEFRLLPVVSLYDLDISQYGFAFARQGNRFSFGVAVSAYALKLDSLTQRYRFFSAGGPADYSRPANHQTQTGDSEELGFIVGLRWDKSPKTSIGLVYRFSPEFDIGVRSVGGSPFSPGDVFVDETVVFNVPNVAGLGFSFHPTQNITFNLDFNAVFYADMVKDFFIIFDADGEDPEDYIMDDVIETHVGFEYVLSKSPIPLALRFGAWHDPDHRLRYEGSDELIQAQLFGGEDQIHYTAGIGVALTSHIQLDAAADISDISDTIAVSFAYRF